MLTGELRNQIDRIWQQAEIKSWLEHDAKGVTMLNLNTQIVRSIPFAYPPLEEQRRIVEVLDRAEALRAKRRAALALLDTLTQSTFLDMFGDPRINPKAWPRLALAALISSGPQNGIYMPSADYGTGVPIVRINQQDVKSFVINVPPLALQQDFARRIAAVEKLKTANRASLAELDALFASLQHRAFRGEL
ncbi:MAG: restriction endonuclease subunit S [Myxococcales bacterium]|nr:restriction endonuclease subunit S [Myxococcales bacterium]